MTLFMDKTMQTLFGETVQMTRSRAGTTRSKEIKEWIQFMEAQAMIQSQEEIHHQISFMVEMAMI